MGHFNYLWRPTDLPDPALALQGPTSSKKMWAWASIFERSHSSGRCVWGMPLQSSSFLGAVSPRLRGRVKLKGAFFGRLLLGPCKAKHAYTRICQTKNFWTASRTVDCLRDRFAPPELRMRSLRGIKRVSPRIQREYMAVGQNPVPLVNIKLGGELMFIHLQMEP